MSKNPSTPHDAEAGRRTITKMATAERRQKMTDAERRQKSDEAKRERGEKRLTMWLPAEATEALRKITGGDDARGAVTKAITAALLAYEPQPK